MKTVTNLEVETTTENKADAEAVLSLISIMLSQFKRNLEGSSTKVKRVTFETTIQGSVPE